MRTTVANPRRKASTEHPLDFIPSAARSVEITAENVREKTDEAWRTISEVAQRLSDGTISANEARELKKKANQILKAAGEFEKRLKPKAKPAVQ